MQEEQGQALPLERDGPRRCQAPDAGAKIKPPDESAKPTRTARASESEKNLGTSECERNKAKPCASSATARAGAKHRTPEPRPSHAESAKPTQTAARSV